MWTEMGLPWTAACEEVWSWIRLVGIQTSLFGGFISIQSICKSRGMQGACTVGLGPVLGTRMLEREGRSHTWPPPGVKCLCGKEQARAISTTRQELEGLVSMNFAFVLVWSMVSPCSLGCPQNHNPVTLVSWVLGIQLYASVNCGLCEFLNNHWYSCQVQYPS